MPIEVGSLVPIGCPLLLGYCIDSCVSWALLGSAQFKLVDCGGVVISPVDDGGSRTWATRRRWLLGLGVEQMEVPALIHVGNFKEKDPPIFRGLPHENVMEWIHQFQRVSVFNQ